jgi:hypothetical protein
MVAAGHAGAGLEHEAVIADATPVVVRDMFVRAAPIVLVVETARDEQSEDSPWREAS